MRRHRLALTVFVWLAAVACVTSTATAQVDCKDQALPRVVPWDSNAPEVRLTQLYMAGCLGGESDPTAISRTLRQAIVVKDPSDSESLRPTSANALDLLIAHVVAPVTGVPVDIQAELGVKLQRARATLGSGVAPAVMPSWELDNATGTIPGTSLPPLGDMDKSCVDATDLCTQAFTGLREVLRISSLARAALAVSETDELRKHLEENTRRLGMWNAYFEKARSQYVWELAVNGALFGDDRSSEGGVRRGFRSVPSGQVLLLHPSVAFEYASAEPEGNRFAGVVVVDLVGFNKWRWKKNGDMGFAIGASVIVAAGDHANLDDAGWGAMLHVNHQLSVGVTFNGRDNTLLVSGDVAQVWTGISDLRKRRMMKGQ